MPPNITPSLTCTVNENLRGQDSRNGTASQRYIITVTPFGITVMGTSPAGLFYGLCTLQQVLLVVLHSSTSPVVIPALTIEDEPDFEVRGVMLDISRDKVPTMEYLMHLIECLASWKINQVLARITVLTCSFNCTWNTHLPTKPTRPSGAIRGTICIARALISIQPIDWRGDHAIGCSLQEVLHRVGAQSELIRTPPPVAEAPGISRLGRVPRRNHAWIQ